MTQKDKVLKYLTEQGSLTQWETIKLFEITRLAPIIDNLKEEGYDIDTEYYQKYNSEGEKYTRCARYSLHKNNSIPIKSRTLFEHLNNISSGKDKNYFDTLTEKEKKEFNVYMIQRYISMDSRFTNFIAYIDKYAFNCLDKEMYNRLLIETLPKEKNYFKYIKKTKSVKEDELLIELLSKKIEVSKQQASEYIRFLSKDDKIKLLQGYAVEDKIIKKYK